MEVSTRESGGTLVLSVTGDLAGPQATVLNRFAEKVRDGGHECLVIDLGQATLVDSVGVGGIVYCYQVLNRAGKKLIVASVPDHAMRTFTDLGFSRMMTISQKPYTEQA